MPCMGALASASIPSWACTPAAAAAAMAFWHSHQLHSTLSSSREFSLSSPDLLQDILWGCIRSWQGKCSSSSPGPLQDILQGSIRDWLGECRSSRQQVQSSAGRVFLASLLLFLPSFQGPTGILWGQQAPASSLDPHLAPDAGSSTPSHSSCPCQLRQGL